MDHSERDAAGSDGRSRRQFIAATGTASALLLAGCTGGGGGSGSDGGSGSSDDSGSSGGTDADGSGSDGATTDSMDDGTAAGTDSMDDDGMATETATDDGEAAGAAWQSVELSTVRGDETFTIAGLDGAVVVQSFAVWCPKCERQSQQLGALGDSVTVVGLNTDPNEDAAKVREHAEENGFDWRFAVAPTEMTESLVEEFGPTVTNAPSTPVIVVCDDGSSSFTSGSINSAEEIRATVSEC